MHFKKYAAQLRAMFPMNDIDDDQPNAPFTTEQQIMSQLSLSLKECHGDIELAMISAAAEINAAITEYKHQQET